MAGVPRDIFAELNEYKVAIAALTHEVAVLRTTVSKLRHGRNGIDGLNGINGRDGRDGRNDEVLASAIAYLAHKIKPALPLPNPDELIEEMLGKIALAEEPKCGICMVKIKDCRLNCGHMLCRECARKVTICPQCRTSIVVRQKTYI